MTLKDNFDNDNIIGVFKIRNAIIKGFDQSFFYISIDDVGMIYFESFCIVQEKEDGTKIEVERECKPKVM